MPEETNERLGLPSASSFERRVFCPGSGTAEPACPQEVEDKEIASRGIDIHDALVTDDDSQLNLSDKIVKEKLRAVEQEALQAWMTERHLSDKDVTVLREVRMWVRDRLSLNPLASAKLDLCAVAEKHRCALIIDAKSGFLDTVPAELNWQLRVQSVALWHEYNYEITDILAAISWGRGKGKFDPVQYDSGSLIWAEGQIQFYCENAKDPFAPRVPGVWCRYCRARSQCKEAAVFALIPSTSVALQPMDKKTAIAKVELLTPQQLAFIHGRSTIAKSIFEAVKDRLKGLLRDDLAAVGLELKPNAPMRKIGDVQAAYSALKERGLCTDDEFRSMCKMNITDVEETLASRVRDWMITNGRECRSMEDAKTELTRILSRSIHMIPKAPSLKPLKPSK